MQANPSNRWKKEIRPVVRNHDFGLLDVYDAGRNFRQDDHQCDFCGTHLRYTARIAAKDDQEIQFKVGLDCLEHTMGTSWSHMQDVERKIEDLKEEAKIQRRKEELGDEYDEMIDWLERYLEIQDDNFLAEMYEILTEGTKPFSKNMANAVRDNMESVNLDALEKKQKKLREWKNRINDLIEFIAEVDDLTWDPEKDKYVGSSNGYGFAKSVRDQIENRNFITDKQMEALNDVYQEYQQKDRETEEENDEKEHEEVPRVPF